MDNMKNMSIWETCRLLAACTLQHQHLSCLECVTMCSCTTVVRGALAGEILGRYQTAAHMQEKARGFLRRHTRTPYGASCRHHMFYKNPRERGRREIWQALTFPFQLQKIHPPSKRQDALYTQFRSKAQIYHRNYIEHAWIPAEMSICCVRISRQMFALHFLINWHMV